MTEEETLAQQLQQYVARTSPDALSPQFTTQALMALSMHRVANEIARLADANTDIASTLATLANRIP